MTRTPAQPGFAAHACAGNRHAGSTPHGSCSRSPHSLKSRHGRGGAPRNACGYPIVALCLSRDPTSPVESAAECVWTGRSRRVSSAATARRTGNEMACIGTEVRTAKRPGALRDNPAVAATRNEPSRPGPRAMAVARRGVARQRMSGTRQVETLGVRGRIGGAGAFGKRRVGGMSAVAAEVVARSNKTHATTMGCANIRPGGAWRRRGRLTRDNE